MAEFPCGRSVMCAECADIDPSSRESVCLSVGRVLRLPQPEDLTNDELHNITFNFIAETLDDRVTPEMREAAVGSVIELIRH